MNALLDQFISETREVLQGIGNILMQLEQAPGDAGLMAELFRMVHTLKGNSGLFEFPEMTRVLHASEDLMDAVKNGRTAYSQGLADQLLDAMDFVGILCDEIESKGRIDASHAGDSVRLAEDLRALNVSRAAAAETVAGSQTGADVSSSATMPASAHLPLADLPEAVRLKALQHVMDGNAVHWIAYTPVKECFFQGDDPFFTARQTPDILWGRILSREPWPPLAELDAYRCVLEFQMLTIAPRKVLDEHFRYMPDQVSIVAVDWAAVNSSPAATAPAEKNAAPGAPRQSANSPMSGEDSTAIEAILAAQRQILALDDNPAWLAGRLKSAAGVLVNCCKVSGDPNAQGGIEAALQQALDKGSSAPLLAWLAARESRPPAAAVAPSRDTGANGGAPAIPVAAAPESAAATADEFPMFALQADETTVSPVSRSFRVDQAKIDRLMNLIGETIVSKNALSYLAKRAEDHFGAPELSREINAQYAVINRIAEEMQDTIMQVRMMPVSFVFQRFPRLVRDISRKLGKEVKLLLEGEETEADKNIIESLNAPLIHIIRNSLDHGIETPEVRRASGKAASGTLTIRAAQEGDRVLIDIIDDGKGIDPDIIKRKAYEKGVIDAATLERISDREAVNLVLTAGISTAEVVSDLSGRGVGLDVARTAVRKVNGTIRLESEVGKGTRIRISLPLSMTVTQAMIVKSDGQLFGVPMDHVVEIVRVPCSAIRTFKHSQTTVLRGHIVALKTLNALLGLRAEPQANADDEMAVLVTRLDGEIMGLIVDDFRGTVDIIQKPLSGVLSGIAAYSGSALMGDGSVLMVLNVKEIV